MLVRHERRASCATSLDWITGFRKVTMVDKPVLTWSLNTPDFECLLYPMGENMDSNAANEGR